MIPVKVHVQATGGVVMSIALRDGRTYRIAGERPFRGCEIAKELRLWDSPGIPQPGETHVR